MNSNIADLNILVSGCAIQKSKSDTVRLPACASCILKHRFLIIMSGCLDISHFGNSVSVFSNGSQ